MHHKPLVYLREIDFTDLSYYKSKKYGISRAIYQYVGFTDEGLTKRTTRMTLEVEQLNPNGGYVKGNIVWACSWCNNAKTDTFTEDEFKNIACGINIAWNDRLQQIGSTSKVIFPWQNQVKCCK